MVSRISASFRLVLVAVLCGLNATWTVSAAPRDREITWRAGVGVSEMTPISPRIRSSREDAMTGDAELHQVSLVRENSFASDLLQHVSHLQPRRVASRTSAPTTFSKADWIIAPTFSATLLARENVLTLGRAPRAPDLGRAPPSA
jgi:hypothetical protein